LGRRRKGDEVLPISGTGTNLNARGEDCKETNTRRVKLGKGFVTVFKRKKQYPMVTDLLSMFGEGRGGRL